MSVVPPARSSEGRTDGGGVPSRRVLRYRSWGWALGYASSVVLGCVAAWAIGAAFTEQAILGAEPWQKLDRWQGDVSGVWLVPAVVSVATLLAVVVVVGIRAARHGAVVSDGLLTVRSVFFTSHAPIAAITSVRPAPARWPGPSEPWSPPLRRLLVQDAHGQTIDVSRYTGSRPGGGGPSIAGRLDELVGSRSVRRHQRRRFHPASRDVRRLSIGLWCAVLGAVVAMGAVFAAVEMHAGHLGDRARTASATATVLRTRFVDGDGSDEPRTDIDVAFETRDGVATQSVSKPGRSRLGVEDDVEVTYDPGNPANVELARRPPAEDAHYPEVLGVALAIVAVMLVLGLGLAQAIRRSVRSVVGHATSVGRPGGA